MPIISSFFGEEYHQYFPLNCTSRVAGNLIKKMLTWCMKGSSRMVAMVVGDYDSLLLTNYWENAA